MTKSLTPSELTADKNVIHISITLDFRNTANLFHNFDLVTGNIYVLTLKYYLSNIDIIRI